MPTEACLCPDEDIYSIECCDEDSIYNQGIGDIWSKKVEPVAPDPEQS